MASTQKIIKHIFKVRDQITKLSFQRNLNELLSQNPDITQTDLAIKAGINRSAVVSYTHGTSTPNSTTLIRIANVFAIATTALTKTRKEAFEEEKYNIKSVKLEIKDAKNSCTKADYLTLKNTFYDFLNVKNVLSKEKEIISDTKTQQKLKIENNDLIKNVDKALELSDTYNGFRLNDTQREGLLRIIKAYLDI